MILQLGLTKGKIALLDEEDFLWATLWNWCYATAKNKKGYAARKIKGDTKYIYLHIELMKRWSKYVEGLEVDHIDLNQLNNTKNNLRMVTHQQNNFNKRLNKNNSSGTRGVWYNKVRDKYETFIFLNYRKINLGRYSLLEEAIKVREEAEIKYFGQYRAIK